MKYYMCHSCNIDFVGDPKDYCICPRCYTSYYISERRFRYRDILLIISYYLRKPFR